MNDREANLTAARAYLHEARRVMKEIPVHLATTAQLLEELALRMREGSQPEPPEQWCDDCAHFRYSATQSKTWNPCAKKHAMQFYFPQPHDSPETFGYYFEACVDRELRPDPPPEPEPIDWTHPDFLQTPPPRGGKPRGIK
jgi:hypothetical protein